MVNDEMLQDFALTLHRDYPHAVQRGVWTSMNLRKGIDMIVDESDSFVKEFVFHDRFFDEAERQEILSRCAKIVREKLQNYTSSPLRVCYKVMPNGRVGYRLE